MLNSNRYNTRTIAGVAGFVLLVVGCACDELTAGNLVLCSVGMCICFSAIVVERKQKEGER